MEEGGNSADRIASAGGGASGGGDRDSRRKSKRGIGG